MSASAMPRRVGDDPYHLGRKAGHEDRSTGHGAGGPASKFIVVGYGFWIFLLSDFVMFSAFFAAFAVLGRNYAGGPTGAELFDRGRVALETGALLLSSFTCGLASIGSARRSLWQTEFWLLITVLLGCAFLALESFEFWNMVAEGAGPEHSGFLSSFFALVGLHGLHVTAGVLWALTMAAQFIVKGFREDIRRRMHCWALFWHALDIIWVMLFTVVYLLGSAP